MIMFRYMDMLVKARAQELNQISVYRAARRR